MRIRISKIALGVALALTAMAADAQAGRYHVYSCRTPSGESAPADGWSGSRTGSYTYVLNTCQSGGALIAALGDAPRNANTNMATWAYSSPANTSIAEGTLWRAGDAEGGTVIGARYEFWFAGPANQNDPANTFGPCASGSPCSSGTGSLVQPMSTENRLVAPEINRGSHLYMNASCVGESEFNCKEGEHDQSGYAAAVYLFAADLTLEQNAGPSAGNVSGELASAPAVGGTSDVAFSASDPGSGVYAARFYIDGQLVQSTALDENGGRCRNVGQTSDGLAAFLYVQPCLASVSADVGFDTTKVSAGPHHLLVSVIDAAGNAAPVLDRNITVANGSASGAPGPVNGTNASGQATLTASWKGTRSERLTSRYGRAQTILGRLSGPGGLPIAGAQIDVSATPAYTGAKTAAMQSPITGSDGSFAVRLPGGVSSRSLRFAYRSHLGDALPVTTRTLTLNVDAGIALSINPRTASVGRSILFRGRLLGGPIPRGGKPVVLEARSPGSSWIEFRVVRTDARGRYHASYRFKFPGPVEYRFRVVSEPESDYPFAAGASSVVPVRER